MPPPSPAPPPAPSPLQPLATLRPPGPARAWASAPHPHLPLVATACADRAVRVYSLQTLALQATVAGGHKRSVRCCAWSPHGRGESVLATGSFDASAGIWRRWELGQGDGDREVDFTGGLAGGGGGEGGSDEDEEDEWRFAVILDGHDSEIKGVAWAATAPLLATCSRDKSVWIWEELEPDNFETVAVLQEHAGDVKCVAWHPAEPLLASGSYDDSVRLWREDVDDWACCALLAGHAGTVWAVEWEDPNNIYALGDTEALAPARRVHVEARLAAGPRLLSCSDDLTIRVWRRVPKDRPRVPSGQTRMPSIWKTADFEEEWVEEGRLPPVHDMAVLSVAWSKKTGRVVSTGGDGKIVVYQERWTPAETSEGDVVMADEPGPREGEDRSASETNGTSAPLPGLTEWVVVAELDGAHDVFEVNHVTWAPRADPGKRHEEEEVIVSTGDDGEVKLWTLNS